jgi:peptidoglycan/LPS O-acetylase OafA/YrhL
MHLSWDSRKNALDSLRLVFSILVIFSHCWPLALGPGNEDPLHLLSRSQVSFGYLSVDSFFIMSGFLITASALRSPSIGNYFQKRIARIFPAYIVISILAICVIAPLADSHWSVSLLHRLRNFVFDVVFLRGPYLKNAFPSNPFSGPWNGSLWTIQCEFLCYIGLAFMLVIGVLRQRLLILLTLAVSLLAGFFWFYHRNLDASQSMIDHWCRLGPCYLAGVVFYLYRDRIRLSGRLAILAVVALFAALFIAPAWEVTFPIAGSYLIFVVAFQQWVKLPNLGRFGDFSYGTYLYAFPVQQLLVRYFPSLRSPWVLFMPSTFITLILAVMSWYLVERRFLRPARRRESAVTAIEAEVVV